jgi:membrane protease YdiL (CAAX protease family)
VGAALGALNFVSTVVILRVLRGAAGAHASAMAQAIGASSGVWRYALGFVAAFVAPAAEELFFRAWLQHALKRDLSPRVGRWAFVVSAAVFAVLHAGEVQALVFVGGLITGALMERGRRVEAGLAFHAVNNGLAVAAAFGWF